MSRVDLLYKKLDMYDYIELDEIYLAVCEDFYNNKTLSKNLIAILSSVKDKTLIEGEYIKSLCINKINVMLSQMQPYLPNLFLST